MTRRRVGQAAPRAAFSAVAVTLVAAIATGCAAKVRQDVFDETMAELRADMEALDARTEANETLLADHEEVLAALRSDLEALAAELGEVRTTITELEDGLRFAAPVHFDFDRAEIRATDRPLLDRFARVIDGHYPTAVVTVEGFADPAGSAEYNRRLSERRAEAVVAYLAGEGGLDAARLRTAGYGEDRLVVPDAQGPGRAGLENRRVAFVIEFAGAPGAEVVASTDVSGF